MQITDFQTQIDSINSSVSTLGSTLANVNSQVNGLTNQVATLNTEINGTLTPADANTVLTALTTIATNLKALLPA